MIKITHNSLETVINGKDINLTRIESKLLTILLDGKTHSRTELLARVWKADPSMKTRTIDVTIGRMKRKLGPMGKYLKSVHGVGYKLTNKRNG
jgi:DNA-binding response OmpR family regulator